MTNFVITHLLLTHSTLVHLKGKQTDLSWGRYVLLYPILAEVGQNVII
jgi:hypothetical protein